MTLTDYLQRHTGEREALILRSILDNRPAKTPKELRQIKREQEFGEDCARWMQSLERIGGER